ncbi:MAG TPA: AAA family ATPase [Pyrinomonadaceae bacterium]|jgi:LuxR family maltose regulon positive regulatory protein
MALILDKITAPAELPRVARQRLLAELEESLMCCTSTVICGRAGTGKTLLAADFARRSARRVAWYKVDAADAALQTFAQYLVAAIGSQHPGFGRKSLALLSVVRTPDDAALLAESFVYELTMLEASEPLLLVIDDLHLVYDADWFGPFFQRFLPLLPAESHLLLLGRTLPPAPLWRLRSKQTLRVIDEGALLFTLTEAVELLAAEGLGPEPATSILADTRGRAAAFDAAARELAARWRAASRTTAAPADGDVRARVAAAAGERKGRRLRLVKGLSKPARAT